MNFFLEHRVISFAGDCSERTRSNLWTRRDWKLRRSGVPRSAFAQDDRLGPASHSDGEIRRLDYIRLEQRLRLARGSAGGEGRRRGRDEGIADLVRIRDRLRPQPLPAASAMRGSRRSEAYSSGIRQVRIGTLPFAFLPAVTKPISAAASSASRTRCRGRPQAWARSVVVMAAPPVRCRHLSTSRIARSRSMAVRLRLAGPY